MIDSIAATYRGAGVVARLRFIAKNKRGPTRKLAFKALLSAIKAHTLGTRLYMVRVCLLRARKRVGGHDVGKRPWARASVRVIHLLGVWLCRLLANTPRVLLCWRCRSPTVGTPRGVGARGADTV